jgi:hypothetical protein
MKQPESLKFGNPGFKFGFKWDTNLATLTCAAEYVGLYPMFTGVEQVQNNKSSIIEKPAASACATRRRRGATRRRRLAAPGWPTQLARCVGQEVRRPGRVPHAENRRAGAESAPPGEGRLECLEALLLFGTPRELGTRAAQGRDLVGRRRRRSAARTTYGSSWRGRRNCGRRCIGRRSAWPTPRRP